jgi:signal transduction histidine kinase
LLQGAFFVVNPQSITRESQSPSKSWLYKVTRCLSIRQKIGCGYALALSIAVLGTTVGVVLGDRYQQQSRLQAEDAQEEISFLNRLQTSSLQIQAHQQRFIYLLENPELWQREKSHFFEHTTEFKQLWSKFKTSEGNTKFSKVKELAAELEVAKRFLQTYKAVPESYLLRTEDILKQVDLSDLNLEEIEAVQKRLIDFNNSSDVLKFDEFSDELKHLIELAYEEYAQAEALQEVAQTIRVQIIGASIIVSVAIAVLLAVYTSSEIARPIQAATQIAKQVTQQENFDLQAPVTTKDEVGALATSLNQLVQRVKQLLEEQQAANELQLIQSEKMSSLGRMIAGVAHEINNPINFIYGNAIHAGEYVEELLALLETYATEIPHPPQAVQVQAEEIDFEFLKEDLPQLIESMKVGAERTRQIILSLKDFSRLDEAQAHSVDLHACIDSTLLILNNRIKKDITVIRNYGDIPMIEGYAGLLYQVFMNLLSNAIDALEESRGEKQILITTQCQDNGWVTVKIVDNASGIPLENQAKIFDTFFTTKPRGVGTGLGLAISRQLVVEKHGGKITCNSEVGAGTEFAIALPIKHQHHVESPQKNCLLATT